ncbi:MAG: hypothetical protein L6246_01485 [Thermodesulfovibrionales bacterium]|nr:hypothetical protein [Thermodesulfovibrionales bacterium]
MVKNPKLLIRFENEELRKEKLSYKEALKIFEAMWKEAVSLGIFPPKDPLDGIEDDIRLAKILNSCTTSIKYKPRGV